MELGALPGFIPVVPAVARPAFPPKCPRRREGAAAVMQLQEDCRLALFP